MAADMLHALHEQLLKAGVVNGEFDDADHGLLAYLLRVLGDRRELKDECDHLRCRVGELEERLKRLRSERKVLRQVLVTAGLVDPTERIGSDHGEEYAPADESPPRA